MCDTITIKCGKCRGTGILSEYRHIAGGTCFACHGIGEFTYKLKQYERRQEKKRIEAEKKLVQQEQNRILFVNKLYDFATEHKDNPEFVRCMSSCPDIENGLYYEMHLQNTMRFMKSRGLIRA